MITEEVAPSYESVLFTPIPFPEPEETPPARIIQIYDPGYLSRLEDYTPNSRGPRQQWRSFQHYKSVRAKPKTAIGVKCYIDDYGFYPLRHSVGQITNESAGYLEWHPGGTIEPYGQDGRLDADLLPLYVPTPDGNFVPAPTNLAALESMALKTMLPIIKAELSLPNFILELKDFKEPIRTIGSVFKSGSFLGALKKLGVIGKPITFKRLLQGAAGSYLNYSFNIKPLISDIAKIYSAMSRTERRINDFVTRAGRPQNKHFVYSWAELSDVHNVWTSLGYQSWENSFVRTSTHHIERHVTHEPTVFHAQIQYNYSYTGYQTEHAQLLGHLDSLGVNLNPAIIWNAIPWSFVVDWVLGIGPYLDSLKSENMKPLINIRRYLWSVKRARRISVSKGTKVANGPILSLGYMPSVQQTAYRRSVGLASLSSITSSGLSLNELSLGAALVITNSRRRRKQR
jgi:hypothetical protein